MNETTGRKRKGYGLFAMAATIYSSLGIPATAAWLDHQDRPHHIYEAEPIAGLT